MTHNTPHQTKELEGAFQAFNLVSEQLMKAYGVLELRVAQLNEELAAARSERLLQLAEKERIANRLGRLLSALPAGVVVLDGQGIVQECNTAALQLLGEPLQGIAWDRIVARAFQSVSEDGQEIRLTSGKQVNLSRSPLGSEPGQIILLHDVTETRRLQTSLEKNKRLSSMGEMVASLAHQIRTPLSAALLYSSNLSDGKLDWPTRQRFSEKALQQLHHLEYLINDMLVFAKGGEGLVEAIQVSQFLNAFLQLMEQALQSANATLSIEATPQDFVFYGNQQTLLTALQNLAMNAIQVQASGVKIRVRVFLSSATTVCFEIEDNGPGIEPKLLDRIFEPFYTTRSNGTGLGLAVVRAVILSHRGEVKVASQPGLGTTFTMNLPRDARELLLPSGTNGGHHAASVQQGKRANVSESKNKKEVA